MVNKPFPHIELKNKRLNVEIAHPGTFYNGSRFDWTAFITKIVLDGKYSFCMPESLIPGQGSGGFGLCNEFGISTPIGYTEANPGEKFPKLGTGLLTRFDESDYFFFDKYEVQPFEIKISTDSNTAFFRSEPSQCNGYAATLTKKVSISDNRLTIDYCLENTGNKQIITEEYCHNFIAINEARIGPGYTIKFPYEVQLDEIPDVMAVKNNVINFTKMPKNDFYCRPQGFNQVSEHYWEVINTNEKAGVREYSNFPINIVAVWGTSHVVSPEVFINIDLSPGNKMEWSRKYEFFSL